MDSPRPQLSVSMLDDLAFCGVRWRFRYGETFKVSDRNIVKPPSVPMAVGTAVHSAVEANMRHKMHSGELLPVGHVADTARDSFVRISEEEGLYLAPEESFAIKETIGGAVDQATALARVHCCDVAPSIQPQDVERKFVLETPSFGFDLKGQIDLVEHNGTIRDTKTRGQKPPDHWPRTIQMAMYSIAFKKDKGLGAGSLPTMVVADCLVKYKTGPKYIGMTAVPDDTWLSPLFRRLEQFADLIAVAQADRRQVFAPARPEDPMCSRRYCPYWSICPYFSGKD